MLHSVQSCNNPAFSLRRQLDLLAAYDRFVKYVTDCYHLQLMPRHAQGRGPIVGIKLPCYLQLACYDDAAVCHMANALDSTPKACSTVVVCLPSANSPTNRAGCEQRTMCQP